MVEVLIATLSFAILLTALNTTFYAGMRLRSTATRNTEPLIPLSQAAAIIKRDLRGLLPTNLLAGPLVGQPQGTALNGSGRLEFYTSSGVVDEYEPWGDVQKVAYYLQQSTWSLNDTNGLELMRSVTRNVLPVTTAEIEEIPLLSGVAAVQFAFYDGATWQNSWDSTTAAVALPEAIRISVQWAGQNYRLEANEPLEFVVPLLVQARTNQTATASNSAATGAGGGAPGGGQPNQGR